MNKALFILRILVLPGFLCLSWGCSLQKLAVKSTGGILANGLEAMQEESDLGLAEQATASNLKLIEALIKSDPKNDQLLLLAAEGFTSYALGFIEDESPERASQFYLRARDYGLQVLTRKREFASALDAGIESFQTSLSSFSRSDVAALFWTANAWGSYINLNKTDVNALAAVPKVTALMNKALSLDETFYYGGPHLFMGTLMASRPRILGGDPEQSLKHFKRCLEINEGKFLMAKYFYAQSYAVQNQKRELFRRLLNEILEAPADLLPAQRLANEIAKKKAGILLEKEDDLFF